KQTRCPSRLRPPLCIRKADEAWENAALGHGLADTRFCRRRTISRRSEYATLHVWALAGQASRSQFVGAIEEFAQAPERRFWIRPAGSGGEIEAELLGLGVADELPVIGKRAAVAVAEVLQDDGPRRAEAGGHLEQLDQLGGRQPARTGWLGPLR